MRYKGSVDLNTHQFSKIFQCCAPLLLSICTSYKIMHCIYINKNESWGGGGGGGGKIHKTHRSSGLALLAANCSPM